MSQAEHKGAERNCLFKNEAAGPTPDFSKNAHGTPVSAGAAFAAAKGVTAEVEQSSPSPVVFPSPHAQARTRPPMRPCGRMGNVFSQAAEAVPLSLDQAPRGNPPLTQSHSPSLGFGFPEIAGALAPEPMPSPQSTAARSGSEAAPAALGKERVVSPNTDSSIEDDAWNRARWSEFHALKKRQWSLIQRFKENDPTNEHLATLQNNVSFTAIRIFL